MYPRILLITAHESTFKALEKWLERWLHQGIELVFVSDQQKAINLIAHEQFTLVLYDATLNLPITTSACHALSYPLDKKAIIDLCDKLFSSSTGLFTKPM